MASVQFPSEVAIINYLNLNPQIKYYWYSCRDGVINRIARVFKNATKTPNEVREAANQTLLTIGTEISLSKPFIELLSPFFIQALMDCANGKPIEFEK
jgi:hypothetical protein